MTNTPSVRTASHWAIIEQFARQGAMFIVSLVLARLLSPADFGLVALVLIFASLAGAMLHAGLGILLVRQRTSHIEDESSIFWFAMGTAILAGVCIVAMAPTFARWIGEPVLAELMPLAAAQLFLAAVAIVPSAILNRELRIRPLTIAGIVSAIIGGGAGIYAASKGMGPWSIAIYLVVMQAVNSACVWFSSGWRPKLYFDRTIFARHGRFVGFLSFSATLEVLYTSGVGIIIGKFYGVRELGLFNRAQGVQQLPGNVISAALSRMAIPVFVRHLDDAGRLRDLVRQTNAYSMVVNLPAMAFLAATSPTLLIVLFGSQWLEAAPVLAILCVAGALMPLHVINLQLLLAQERSGQFAIVEMWKKVIGVSLAVAGSFYGVIGLSLSHVVYALAAFFLNARYTRQSIEYGPIAQLRDLLPCFALSALVGAGSWLTLDIMEARPAMELLTAMSISAFLFVGGAIVMRPGGQSVTSLLFAGRND